jgi:hypothetical protein
MGKRKKRNDFDLFEGAGCDFPDFDIDLPEMKFPKFKIDLPDMKIDLPEMKFPEFKPNLPDFPTGDLFDDAGGKKDKFDPGELLE